MAAAQTDAEAAVSRLEEFLDRVLRAQLSDVMQQRDATLDRASQCHHLRRMLDDFDELHKIEAAAEVSERSLQVDLGSRVFCEAHVTDASIVHTNIGAGIVVPLTRAEAHRFLVRKERMLKNDAQRLAKEALRVKYRTRLVMEAILRLQGGDGTRHQ